MAPSISNQVHEDPELNLLLQQLDSVDTKQDFDRWRNSFVNRFDEFLGAPERTQRAEKIYKGFSFDVSKLLKLLRQLEQFIMKGAITVDSCTVKAQNCLSEVKKQLRVVVDQFQALLPGTSNDEKKAGYSKFNMGAVLVRSGFSEYAQMVTCTAIINNLRNNTYLEDAADRQIIEEMEYYLVKQGVFCDIMADLRLYQAMVKSLLLGESVHSASYGSQEADSDNEEEFGTEKAEAKGTPTESPATEEQKPPTTRSRPRKQNIPPPDLTKGVVFECPAPSGRYDKSEKAQAARMIGIENVGKDGHDPYKPVERTDWNSKDYYHGNDGENPFLFLKKNPNASPEESNQGLDDGSTGAPEKTSSEKEENKTSVAKSNKAKPEDDEDGDNDNVNAPDDDARPSKAKSSNSMRPSMMRGSSFDDQEGDNGAPGKSGDGGDGGDGDGGAPTDNDNADGRVNVWGSNAPDDDDRPSEARSSTSMRPSMMRGSSFDDEKGDNGAPDESDASGEGGAPTETSAKPAKRTKPRKKERTKKVRRAPPPESTRQGSPSGDNGESGGSGVPTEPSDPSDERSSSNPPESMRPSMMRGSSFDAEEGNNGAPDKSGDDKDDDNDCGVNVWGSNAPDEGVRPSEARSSNSMRPSTMRGSSFDDEEGANSAPNEADDSGNGGAPTGEPSNPDTREMEHKTGHSSPPSESMRPSTVRGSSFDDDEAAVDGASNEPALPTKSRSTDPHSEGMRPSTIRGSSFDDDIGTSTGRPTEARSTSPAAAESTPSLAARESKSHGKKVAPKKSSRSQEPAKLSDSGLARPTVVEPTAAELSPTATEKEKKRVIVGLDFNGLAREYEVEESEDCSSSANKTIPDAPKEITPEQKETREKCYMWYARMGQPNRESMKRRVVALPKSCDITVEDVELLPWVRSGAFLSVREMSKLFLAK